MRTRYYFSFVILMLIIACVYFLLIAGLVAFCVFREEKDAFFWLGIGVGLLGLYVFIKFLLGFRYVFPKMEINSKGLYISNFFGLMPKRFYKWEKVDAFKVRDLGFDDFVGFKVYSIFSNGTEVVMFHDFFYHNIDEFHSKLDVYLDQID